MSIKKFRIISFKKSKPLVAFKKISLSFGNRLILDDINFNINRGEILGLLGPNGVGKSTIFNLLTGMIKPNYGSILFDNTNVEVLGDSQKLAITNMTETTFQLQDYYAGLLKNGANSEFSKRMHDFDSLNAVIGTSELLNIGKKYE